MAHTSPAVNLTWAFLAVMLGTFLVYHLWSFDRFRCLRWNRGPYSGPFKRLMTYAYLLSVPLLIVYAVGFAIIKYTYGFAVIPGLGIVPVPYAEWSQTAQNAVFPLYLSFSVAWGLELLTHLEELCFWLFLVNSSSPQQDWFQSLYFKAWAVGSCIAVVAMPLITILTRQDVYKCEAFTFLAGGLASISLTIWFLPVMWTVPSFLANLKDHGVEAKTLVRLTTFHELNCIRVVFRFLFTIPFIILGVDGVRPHQHINDKMFPTDFLAILAGIGCVVSSGITLVIFFPRSIEGEMARKEQRRARRRQRAHPWTSTYTTERSDLASYLSIMPSKTDLDKMEAASLAGGMPPASVAHGHGLPAYERVVPHPRSFQDDDDDANTPGRAPSPNVKVALENMGSNGGSISLKPNRLNRAGDVELGGVLTESEVDLVRAESRRARGVSNLVYEWRSPIEIGRAKVARWQRQL